MATDAQPAALSRAPTSAARSIRRALLLAVPFTSIPWFPVGDATVKSLCFPLAAALVIAEWRSEDARRLYRDPAVGALALFAVVICAPQLWRLVARPEEFAVLTSLGVTAADRFVRACLSLAVGVALYLGFRLALRTPDRLREGRRLLVLGIAASSLWAILQLAGDTLVPSLGLVLRPLDALVTVPVAVTARGHGFAYEASWLASQETLIALPILYQAVLFPNTHGLFPAKLALGRQGWAVSVDTALLGVVIAGLLATYSRIGLAVLVMTILVLVLLASRATDRRYRTVILVMSVVVLAAVVWVAVATPYVTLTLAGLRGSLSAVEFFSSIAAGPRFALWSAAWAAFVDHPLFGVGLGQFGFHFATYVPTWSVLESEVPRFLLSGEVPNPKNMWLRLLAETGIVGMITFVAFLAMHYWKRKASVTSPGAGLRLRWRVTPGVVFAAGATIALLGDFVSLDTFALPQVWVCLALLRAGSTVLAGSGSNPGYSLADR